MSQPTFSCSAGNIPDCILRIAAARSDSNSYRLRTCEGSNVQLQCEGNSSCSDVVRWRSLEGSIFSGKTLFIQNVQREDGGTYICEVTDYYGRVRLTTAVSVEVQCKNINIQFEYSDLKITVIHCVLSADYTLETLKIFIVLVIHRCV